MATTPEPSSAQPAAPEANASSDIDTRTRLRAVALDLFLEKGFAATSVREIASAAGVMIPALYYHYVSKDGLLMSLVEPLMLDGEAVIDAFSDAAGVADPARALGSYYDVVTAHLGVFRLVVSDQSVRSHDAAGHRLAAQGRRFLRLLTGGSQARSDEIRAYAALGAIRRPLRMDTVDVVADRAQILACVQAALTAQP